MTPDLDIANHLQTAGLGTVATDIFAGPMKPPSAQISQSCIFCISTGGLPPSPYLDASTSDYNVATVQVLVRGDVGAYATAQTKANTARAAIQRATVAGYVAVYVRESNPNFIGLDDTEHPMFTLNAEMQWKG